MLSLPISLAVVHFVADFILQSDNMALRKSSDNEWLTIHALTYAVCFAPWGLRFAILTFVTHWATDYWTSRCTTKLWFLPWCCDYCGDNLTYPSTYCEPCGKYSGAFRLIPRFRHWFFVMIGADQLIHFATLAFTYWSLFP